MGVSNLTGYSMILDNILGAIGKTPIVKLNRVGSDLDCELYGKCEYSDYLKNLIA